MDLDEKNQVLVAIYTEYQKPLPKIYKSINHEIVNLEKLIFNSAIAKLENEGYIKGSILLGALNPLNPKIVRLTKTVITSKGIKYVEDMLEIDEKLSKNQKANAVKQYAEKCGWNTITEIATKVITEFALSAIR